MDKKNHRDDDIYRRLTDRNRIFIPPETQEKIRKTRILIAGCGMGSTLAINLVRTGFTKFVLFDGDDVDITNLNRQAFFNQHMGKNKAEATAALLNAINPEVEVEVHPDYMNESDGLDSYTRNTDYIINTVDYNNTLFLLEESARKAGIISIQPFNVGFTAYVIVFSPKTISMREMLGNPRTGAIMESLVMWLSHNFSDYVTKLIESNAEEFKDIVFNNCPVPQLGITVALSSILITTILLKHIQGQALKYAPEFYQLDVLSLLEV